MVEHELELRLRSAARALDARAPAFDPAVLSNVRRRRVPRAVAVLACLVALAAVPAAIAALGDLFDVDEVPALGPLEPGVAPPFAGRSIPVSSVEAWAPFPVRVIPSLGAPDEARVRDDITGGMVTLVYRSSGVLLTQWRTTDVHTRIAVVPAAGKADEVDAGGVRALWIEGAARGTFTLIGADGAVHRESVEVSPGVLLWRENGMAFLLQAAGSKMTATRLAAEIAG